VSSVFLLSTTSWQGRDRFAFLRRRAGLALLAVAVPLSIVGTSAF
jgi:hypothetical protein